MLAIRTVTFCTEIKRTPNRSAAAYLNLSAKTVEKHRANLMRKLHLNSAVELALLAVDLGLVQRPGMPRHMHAAAVVTSGAAG